MSMDEISSSLLVEIVRDASQPPSMSLDRRNQLMQLHVWLLGVI